MKSSSRQQLGLATDLLKSTAVQVWRDCTGKLWVNVDGICALRIGHVDYLEVQDDCHQTENKLREIAEILENQDVPSRSQPWSIIRSIREVLEQPVQGSQPPAIAEEPKQSPPDPQ